jgi:hypothetical protein
VVASLGLTSLLQSINDLSSFVSRAESLPGLHAAVRRVELLEHGRWIADFGIREFEPVRVDRADERGIAGSGCSYLVGAGFAGGAGEMDPVPAPYTPAQLAAMVKAANDGMTVSVG